MLVQELIQYVDKSTHLIIATESNRVIFNDSVDKFENIYKDLHIENILSIDNTLKIFVSYDN